MAKQASVQGSAKTTKSSKSKQVKSAATKPASRAKVDYYPNRMSLAVAALAVCTLILLAVIVVYL